ncbi:MAG TPA: cellulose binding domain-containing protein [Kineosporiaceae bacterium]|nr:cellulose binding domain-containing protein [Kineosporiaceae bacterium]
MRFSRPRWSRYIAVAAALLVTLGGGIALTDGFGGTSASAADGVTTATAGCGRNPSLTTGEHTIQTRGKNRTYILDMPASYDRNHPYRVVFGFHWMGGTQADVATGQTVQRDVWAYYGLKRLAGNSTIFVAPQGFGNGWGNAGGEDVVFVDDLVKQLEGDLCVDTSQVFSVGFSYGGAMSYALACERPNVFRAVAVQSGGGMSGCNGSGRPVAYLGVHGIGDPVLNVGIGRSLRDTFVKNNGCTARNAPEPAPGSRTHVVTDYSGCAPGYPVEWAAFDEGHIAAPQDGAGGDSGSRTWVPAVVWTFFSQFSATGDAPAPAAAPPAPGGPQPVASSPQPAPPAGGTYATVRAAATPPMGWNTWNTFGCNIDEKLIRGMADTIVTNGMRDLGYRYVVVDDCWFNPDRDAAGNLQANPTRFPSGMKALGDYLHGKDLRFGIYQVPGTKTCAQTGSYPGATGSQGHEAQDARQFAAWGVDYLKYDWCSGAGSIDEQVATFAKMRDALAATGRPIVYSINPNSFHAKTGPQRNWGDVANLWRTTEDITNAWDTGQTNGFPMGIQNIVNVNVPLASYARPGAFNDPDMLEVGRGGMTETEMRSHFALWSMMAAPLMAGNDLRSADPATLNLLKNRDLIAINQDALGQQAVQVSANGSTRVLAKKLSNGDVAVALFNQGKSTATISTTASALELPGSSFTLRDVWTAAVTNSRGDISAAVPAHGTVVYRVSPAGAAPQPAPSPSTTTTTPPAPTTAPPSGITDAPRPQPATCTAKYRTVASWPGGFLGEVVVTAGAPLNGWHVKLSLGSGQQLVSVWNGTSSGRTGTVSVANAPYNAAIDAGASQLFGFVANGTPGGAPGVTGCGV